MPLTVDMNHDSANDAWKRCSIEMVNLISKSTGPPLIRDYNNLLVENRDLKKQYKMSIAALDSIITENNSAKVGHGCLENSEKAVTDYNTIKSTGKIEESETSMPRGVNGNSQISKVKNETDSTQISNGQERNNNTSDSSDSNRTVSFKTIVKKFDASNEKLPTTPTFSTKGLQKTKILFCQNCLNVKSGSLPSKKDLTLNDGDRTTETQALILDIHKLKRNLEQNQEENLHLEKELHAVKRENCELQDQVHSLELSLKTLTEAINLQDEQLTEYGSIVTSLKKSRAVILEKFKEANARNSYNIMIMENIEQEVENLRRQLDAYNDLLVNRNIQQIDKASSTDQMPDDHSSYEEIMKKKDNYITLLQDRLCEAIVDLKTKDSEIKNHTNSVKTLISNYEAEKTSLEGRLKLAHVSTEKLEEHKIKQQETMKQLMKLIEFLQVKLEKVNKK